MPQVRWGLCAGKTAGGTRNNCGLRAGDGFREDDISAGLEEMSRSLSARHREEQTPRRQASQTKYVSGEARGTWHSAVIHPGRAQSRLCVEGE